jgi:hypothetical protein
VNFFVEDEELRRHLLLNERDEEAWLWRNDLAVIDSKSISSGALIDD